MFKLYKNGKLLLVAPYWEDLVSFVEIMKKGGSSLPFHSIYTHTWHQISHFHCHLAVFLNGILL